MKIITCDNCGEKGNPVHIGDLCDKCRAEWEIEWAKIQATKDELDRQIRIKFHIRPNK